jgi:hypothetical protein
MVCLESMVMPKPQVCSGSKTQSPSTLGWRLRVEVRHTCRFETTFTLSTRFGLIASRRYRSGRTPSSRYVDAHTRPLDYGAALNRNLCDLWDISV